jgi:hypothetical protein
MPGRAIVLGMNAPRQGIPLRADPGELPLRSRHLLAAARRTPRAQNNSGLPQGPATGSVVG